MQEAIMTDLISLGIPFFGTRQDLLLDPETTIDEIDTRYEGKISILQLKNLQQRMIEHLEDLFKD